MKRFFSTFLIMAMLAAVLIGCGNKDFDTDAYKEKLNNILWSSIEDTEFAISDLIAYDGVLPDEAAYAFLEVVNTVGYSLDNAMLADDFVKPELNENSYISPRYSESLELYGTNYIAIHKALSGKLSEAFEDYLRLMTKYNSSYMIDDSALQITWDELAQFLIDWSNFEIKYPEFFPMEIEGALDFGFMLYSGQATLDNTPLIVDDKLSPEVQASYEGFLAYPENEICAYYTNIKILYEMWKTNDFKYTEQVKEVINLLRPTE